MTRRALLLLLVLLVLLLASACKKGGDDDEAEKTGPVKVTCRPAEAKQISERVRLRGVVSAPPDKQATVTAQTPGRIAQLLVHEGAQVKQGEVIAVVDDPQGMSALAEAEAALATARANDEVARAAAARAHKLFDEGITARKEVEEAEARASATAAEVRAATARRELAQTQRERARVKTPITGTVVRLLKRAGELVDGTPATPIAEIADPAHLELRADAPAASLMRVVEGMAVDIRLDALPDRSLAGRIFAVAPGVDPATSLGWVRVALVDDPDAGVRARLGLAGQASVDLGSRRALNLPAAAVRRGAEGKPEVVRCDGDKAKVVEVRLGARDDAAGTIEIAAGLEAGQEVVIDHVLNLEDGAELARGSGK